MTFDPSKNRQQRRAEDRKGRRAEAEKRVNLYAALGLPFGGYVKVPAGDPVEIPLSWCAVLDGNWDAARESGIAIDAEVRALVKRHASAGAPAGGGVMALASVYGWLIASLATDREHLNDGITMAQSLLADAVRCTFDAKRRERGA